MKNPWFLLNSPVDIQAQSTYIVDPDFDDDVECLEEIDRAVRARGSVGTEPVIRDNYGGRIRGDHGWYWKLVNSDN